MIRACIALALALTVSSAFAEIDVGIRFYDKRIYFPESEIAVKVSLTNNGSTTYRFKLAENRMYSLAFEGRTPSNRDLDAAQAYKRTRADSGPVFYREITVEPGEEYSFVERLETYLAIEEPGSYAVQASFWPDLAPRSADDRREPRLSNILVLSVKPSPAGLPSVVETLRRDTGELLVPEALAPDEVVSRTIEARQRSRWNEFFLYLDLEALLMKSQELARSYTRASDEGRRKMLETFRRDLENPKAEAAIVNLPSEYTVVETRYGASTGTVRVLEKFAEKGFTSLREYQYEVRRREGIWYIVGYTVVNKGTE